MKIITVPDQKSGSQKAFALIKNGLQDGAKVLGLATGSTPVMLYQEMVQSDLDFSKNTSINLDEYVSLPADNPQSYHYFMNQHLFQYKKFQHSYIPNGVAADISAEIKRYDQIIKENPIDIQILGIGQNGHIGFNEPQTPFDCTTHRVQLTQSTIEANARFFDNQDEVPKEAISMGIASIMQSKHIILMAWGANKAEAIYQTVKGPVTTACPASILQQHPQVTLIVDEAAAAKLN
ncbi:glucosamine-6-phosphate deaminase [Bombilactobacillus bombi]|uniref:glucosamine-6-phosphate deaminase n=1 Tax=Bombilactobacillus bombi TaxID=1303590 RepID=UPI0015E5F3FA|nr:glucosamine-6-phosphate deaminase [Bombilactobacillus bombi]MBA1433773.1 glucosamine-6-phosphate deaminase [Bombilactobacillus bombi]